MNISFPTLVKLCKFIDPTTCDGFSIDYSKIEKIYKFQAKLTMPRSIQYYNLEFETPQDETFFLLKFSNILDKKLIQ